MIVTYNWLKEFVEFDMSPEALADYLTMLGLEVEGMHSLGDGLDEVVVAVVEEKAQHPNADKLSLCKVNDGKDVLEIVCGAQNFKAGDKVALARIGAVLPGDFKIKRSKIRGAESFGMLCSERELGLSDESSGIMILPQDYALGVPLFSAMGLKDTVYEIGLTPNRADCLSVVGVAREIAAKSRGRVRYPVYEMQETESPIRDVASVTIDDADMCPRYIARYIADCKIGPSPQWLVNRLNAVGQRSINNVVDITNYVLMEYGHPLHAFDFDLLQEGRIVVRRASEGECFTTLDGQERQLQATDLTIRDGKRAVALAGIMGGMNSEVTDSTRNILLESAYFDPSAIRSTSRRLGLHTEASHRYERGADINILRTALDRAALLIAELAGGKIAKGVLDVYPREMKPTVITFRQERVQQMLGISPSTEEIVKIFEGLELECSPAEPGVLSVAVPSFRVDLEREIDLIEEVARLYGYNNIPVTMPKISVSSDRPAPHQKFERKIKDLLVAQGFNEVINYSFIAPSAYEKILLPENDSRRTVIKILNPLTDEQSVMRTSLLPGLLESAARNVSFRNLDLRLFEMRRVYIVREGQELPDEPLYLAGFLSGGRNPEGWNQGREELDFFDVKGILETIFEALNISNISYVNKEIDVFYHPGKSATLYHKSERIGSLGELHPALQENYGLERRGYYFELDFEKLFAISSSEVSVVAPSRFPDTFRDIAMLVNEDMEAASILETLQGVKVKELQGVELFDLYKGANIEQGKKSLAVRIRYRSYEKTLTDDEVNAMHKRVLDNLLKKLDVTIR